MNIDYRFISGDENVTDGIVELYRAGNWWSDDSSPELIPSVVRGSFAFAAAFAGSGRMIGMGRAISDGVSDAYIQDLVVLGTYRGRGIGRKIAKMLIEYCLNKGVLWIGLIAEPGSERFYESLGFGILPGHVPFRYKGV